MQNLDSKAPKLALVVPCYNEEEVINITFAALQTKLQNLAQNGAIAQDSFLCFVDDGSKDKTFEILKNLAQNSASITPPPQLNAKIKTHIIKLSKNCGHQNALLAGLEFASDKCDCAISIDCDLQDDINVFDEFLEKFKNGADVVLGVRNERKTDTAFKKFTALGFYKFMSILGVNITYNHADYRLLSARAVKNLLSFKEVNLFLRGMVPLLGFKSEIVYYERLERAAGVSKYPLRKMLSFAWNGITSFSIAPLRVVSALGVGLFFIAFGLLAYVLCVKFLLDDVASGWASIAAVLCFFGGVQLLGLGIIGEYVGKIYQEVKARPRYFVEEII